MIRVLTKQFAGTALAVFLMFGLAGCIHPISKEERHSASSGVTLSQVQSQPDRFVGQNLLLGGAIIAIETTKMETTLEILQWQLNRLGEPTAPVNSGQRYLLTTTEELDPDLYIPGRLVTLTGSILGTDTRLIREHEYSYPLLELREIHLWQSPFLYGIHTTETVETPTYVNPEHHGQRHPYDTTPYVHPYSPYEYRGSGQTISR